LVTTATKLASKLLIYRVEGQKNKVEEGENISRFHLALFLIEIYTRVIKIIE